MDKGRLTMFFCPYTLQKCALARKRYPMEDTLEKNEQDLLNELRKHENQWVALYGQDPNERVVASGEDAEMVIAEARKQGFKDFSLMYVRSFSVGFLPASD
jgi:hypothetical protein